MAFSRTLLYWQDPVSGFMQSLAFDAVTSETKDDSVDITDHPVEIGSNVADNARDAPALLTIEGIISGIASNASVSQQTITVNGMSVPGTQQVPLDIPPVPLELSESGLIQAGIGAVKGLFSGAPTATLTGLPLPAQVSTQALLMTQDPAQKGRLVYERLLLLKSQHIRINHLTTAYREYSDMMIARLSQPRAIADGTTTAKFQIDFKQIRLASSKTVAAPKPSVVRASAPVAKGAQGTKEADKSEKRKSVARAVDTIVVPALKKALSAESG